MRIIAGTLGGRQFVAPKNQATHPMSEQVRGALFNTLGDITGLSILDAFAGSGALSLEAISRGASKAVAIDNDRRAFETLQDNIAQLGLSNHVKAIKANVSGWSDRNQGQVFDLLFVAPPYDNLQLPVIQKITHHLKPHGLLVLDWPGHMTAPGLSALKKVQENNYGDASLLFYRPEVA